MLTTNTGSRVIAFGITSYLGKAHYWVPVLVARETDTNSRVDKAGNRSDSERERNTYENGRRAKEENGGTKNPDKKLPITKNPENKLPIATETSLLDRFWGVAKQYVPGVDTYNYIKNGQYGYAAASAVLDVTSFTGFGLVGKFVVKVGIRHTPNAIKFGKNLYNKVTKSVPSKFTKPGGGSDAGDFITDHSQKHMFDPSVASTKSRSQFGQDINVKALRDDTMTNPTSAFSDINSRVTKYSKSYDFNISTPATPTGEMRVFINNAKPNRSSQFPYVPRKKD